MKELLELVELKHNNKIDLSCPRKKCNGIRPLLVSNTQQTRGMEFLKYLVCQEFEWFVWKRDPVAEQLQEKQIQKSSFIYIYPSMEHDMVEDIHGSEKNGNSLRSGSADSPTGHTSDARHIPETVENIEVKKKGITGAESATKPSDFKHVCTTGDVNMEASITSDDVVRAGGFGARDDIGSFLPVAIDSTDFEASLRDAQDYEEPQGEKKRPGLGWTEAAESEDR